MECAHVLHLLECSLTVLVSATRVLVYSTAAFSVTSSVEPLPALLAWMATICPQINAGHVTLAVLPVLDPQLPAPPALKARLLMALHAPA
jgi:hypothetical protein